MARSSELDRDFLQRGDHPPSTGAPVLHTSPLHWLRSVAPFAWPLACLCLILWCAWRTALVPYDGAQWSMSTGNVLLVDADGPAHALLAPGDRILRVDGAPLGSGEPYAGKRPGDLMHFEVLRAGERVEAAVMLAAQPWTVAWSRQTPILVAIAFWCVSMVVLAFKPSGIQSFLFALFCQAFAAASAASAAGVFDFVWPLGIFYVLLWWIGPLALHFHLYFPMPVASAAKQRIILIGYAIALLATLPIVALGPLALRAALPAFFAVSLLWLATCLLATVVLLGRSYRRAETLNTRRQVGLVVLGGCVAFIPFFVLLLLPYALLKRPIVPDSLGYILLLALPLTYGYAILNYRLIHLDRYVNRGATYALVATLLAGLYLILSIVVVRLSPGGLPQHPTVNLALALTLALVAGPIYRRLQNAISYIFYGGSYDYRSAVQHISQALDRPADRANLAQTLCDGIYHAMQLESVTLLLPDAHGAMVVAATAGPVGLHPPGEPLLLPGSPIFRFFQHQTYPIDAANLERLLALGPAMADERSLLLSEHARLWLPFSTDGELLGLCLLGAKRGSQLFDVTDLDILQVVGRLANTAIQNTQLVAQLRQRASESEQVHQQVLRAREAERKRVARELHDQIIQALVGLNYHLSTLRGDLSSQRHEQLTGMQADLRRTVDDVRRICTDLRPPTLDSLGLVPAVRSRLRALERQTSLHTVLLVEGDAEHQLPEEIAVCSYRVIQEALANVQRYAAATEVKVRLGIGPALVTLGVEDDGEGFEVPQHLGDLLADQHFGLIGLRERLELVQGALEISSVPGKGTHLQASIPLPVQHGRAN